MVSIAVPGTTVACLRTYDSQPNGCCAFLAADFLSFWCLLHCLRCKLRGSSSGITFLPRIISVSNCLCCARQGGFGLLSILSFFTSPSIYISLSLPVFLISTKHQPTHLLQPKQFTLNRLIAQSQSIPPCLPADLPTTLAPALLDAPPAPTALRARPSILRLLEVSRSILITGIIQAHKTKSQASPTRYHTLPHPAAPAVRGRPVPNTAPVLVATLATINKPFRKGFNSSGFNVGWEFG